MLLVSGAVVVAALSLAPTASSERNVAVGFSVVGTASANVSAKVGAPVSFIARAALRSGSRIVILRKVGKGLRSVAECRSSPCHGRWVEKHAASWQFLAWAGSGPNTDFKIAGQSRTIRVTWKAAKPPTPPTPPQPPTPPPPLATPGHYSGKSTFNEVFNFDVSADGKTVVNVQTGQVNESCSPDNITLSQGNLAFSGPFPIAADGSFAINTSSPITVGFSDGSVAGTRKVTITGHFSSGTATGTVRTDTSFAHGGNSYSCNSGDQTWTASKV